MTWEQEKHINALHLHTLVSKGMFQNKLNSSVHFTMFLCLSAFVIW